ncbi:hypothetical protein B9Z55_007923 [Caenorhabditis nigoni]|uniref:BTB domain-containing protein n=1 Tax=Caenorhabditis nigoni TaxID=1611254 RepID=A0A2G5VBZ2_9PELO|nr:hypothetical protein B9Z55_007923 [Caenorhabditis nigoni]
MSANEEKKFVIKCVFENLKSLPVREGRSEVIYSPVEKHYNAFWNIRLHKYESVIIPFLVCKSFQMGGWSIDTASDVFINGKLLKTEFQIKFQQNSSYINNLAIERDDFPEYGIDESAQIEFHVKIDKMSGNFRNFDNDVARELSDTVLMVENNKFYVNKMYLSLHSTYFKSLLLGKFEEAKKSEIDLKDILVMDFHIFLSVIYGFIVVAEAYIENLLKLADYFDAEIVMERCEAFLVTISKKSFVEKYQLSLNYKLDNLKKKCLSEMNKNTDFVGLAPENSEVIVRKHGRSSI